MSAPTGGDGGVRPNSVGPGDPRVPAAVDLSVVLVSYNSCDLLLRCIGGIEAAAAGRTFEVIVVDNASRDATVAQLSERFPWVRCLPRTRNYGFASSVNFGTREARGRTIVWLNPDCETTPGSLATLATHLEGHPGDGAVGPSMEWPDGRVQPGAQPFPSPLRLVVRALGLRRLAEFAWVRAIARRVTPGGARMVRGYLDAFETTREPRSVDWITGACIATRPEVVARTGGLDESYFMYSEDADWCQRVRAAGWNITHLPGAVVRHAVSATGHHNPLTDFHHRESLLLYFARHGGGFTFVRCWYLLSCGAHGIAADFARMFGRGEPHRWWALCRMALESRDRLRRPRVPEYPDR